jgi:hypothetical protein
MKNDKDSRVNDKKLDHFKIGQKIPSSTKPFTKK